MRVYSCVLSRDKEYVMLFDLYEHMAAEPYFCCSFELLPLTFINLNVSNKIVKYVMDIRSSSMYFIISVIVV